jgi:hypothetical protein
MAENSTVARLQNLLRTPPRPNRVQLPHLNPGKIRNYRMQNIQQPNHNELDTAKTKYPLPPPRERFTVSSPDFPHLTTEM